MSAERAAAYPSPGWAALASREQTLLFRILNTRSDYASSVKMSSFDPARFESLTRDYQEALGLGEVSPADFTGAVDPRLPWAETLNEAIALDGAFRIASTDSQQSRIRGSYESRIMLAGKVLESVELAEGPALFADLEVVARLGGMLLTAHPTITTYDVSAEPEIA